MGDISSIGVRTARRPLLALLTACLLVAGACGSGDDGSDENTDSTTTTSPGEPQRGGKLVFAVTAETDGWNPSASRWGPSAFNVARAVYDPLTVIDPEGVAQPYLVESITPNDTLTEWTITIREGVTFHNGDPLTTEVLATFLKTMQLSLLAGFAFDPVDAVAVLNDTQVVVITNEPWATFPAMLSGQPGYMVHPDVLTGKVTDPLGTGPFVFKEWTPDDHLTVVANPDYWRPGLPYLDEVEFRPTPDAATRRAALASNDVDLIHTNAAADLLEVGRDGSGAPEGFFAVFDGSAGDEAHVGLNTQTGPTADLEVRRALALATDRQALVDSLYEGFFQIADGPFDPESFWWSDAGWPEPDPDEAAALVEAWEEDNGPLQIRLMVIASPENLELGQALQQQWDQVGIEVEVDAIPEAVFSQAMLMGDFDAFTIQYYNRSDPDEHFHFWDPNRIGAPGELSLNFPRYTDEVIDEALHAARRTSDPEERKALYAEIWQDWAQNLPYLWLYHGQWMLLARDGVEGLGTFTFPDGSPAEPMDWGAVFLTDVWSSD